MIIRFVIQSSRRWLEGVVEALDQQLQSATHGAGVDQHISESHVELLRPILRDMRGTLESGQGNIGQHMFSSLMEVGPLHASFLEPHRSKQLYSFLALPLERAYFRV